MSRWLSVAQAAERIGLTPTTVYSLARAGRIPYYKPAGRLLFDGADLDAWIEKARHAPTAERWDQAARLLAGVV